MWWVAPEGVSSWVEFGSLFGKWLVFIFFFEKGFVVR
jgi:hypothetical protein